MKKLLLKAMLLCMMSSFCVGTALADDSHWKLESSSGTITDYVGPGGDVVIPETVSGIAITRIGRWIDDDNITSLTIPNTITEIESGALSNMTVLETVHLPNSISSLSAFNDCPALKSIVIPGTIKNLGGFARCTALTELILEEGVEVVGGFTECTSLVSVHFPDSLSRFLYGAFSDCTNLTTVRLPSTPTQFESWIFTNTAIKELEICLDGSADFPAMNQLESLIFSDYSVVSNYGVSFPAGGSTHAEALQNLKYLYLPGDLSFGGTIPSDCVVESYDNTPGHYLAIDNGCTYISRGEWEKPTAQVSTPSTSTPSTSTPSTSTPSTGSSSSSGSSSSATEESNPMITLAIIGGVVVVLSVGVVAIVMKKK